MFSFSGTSIKIKLATAAVVAAGALAMPAVSSATTVVPAGQAFSASAGSTTFTPAGGPTVTCTSSLLTSQVPNAPGNTGAIVTAPGTLSFSGCSSSIAGTTTTVSNCVVSLEADYMSGDPTMGIAIPSNCIKISIKTLLTTCTITVDPQTVVGTYNNATNKATFGPFSIPFVAVGTCLGATSPANWAGSSSTSTPVVYTVSPSSIQINP